MGNKTAISWTDATWAPMRGGSRTIAAGIGMVPGSKHKAGGIYELPTLDGMQHTTFPEVA